MPNDHYVPQFYLRRFAAKPRRLWCYESGRHPSLMGIRKAASEIDFYRSDKVNDAFQKIETDSSAVIERLLDRNNQEITDADKEVLSVFISSMSNRVPAYLENQARVREAIINQVNEMVTSDSERFASFAKLVGVGTEDPIEIEATRKILQRGVRIDRERSRVGLLKTALEIMFDEEFLCLLFGKEWNLIECTGSAGFITSDNPIILLPPNGHRDCEGLGFIQASVFLSLSPQRALLLRNKKAKGGPFLVVDQSKADWHNERVMFQAYKQVYASQESDDLEVRFARVRGEKQEFNAKYGLTAN